MIRTAVFGFSFIVDVWWQEFVQKKKKNQESNFFLSGDFRFRINNYYMDMSWWRTNHTQHTHTQSIHRFIIWHHRDYILNTAIIIWKKEKKKNWKKESNSMPSRFENVCLLNEREYILCILFLPKKKKKIKYKMKIFSLSLSRLAATTTTDVTLLCLTSRQFVSDEVYSFPFFTGHSVFLGEWTKEWKS